MFRQSQFKLRRLFLYIGILIVSFFVGLSLLDFSIEPMYHCFVDSDMSGIGPSFHRRTHPSFSWLDDNQLIFRTGAGTLVKQPLGTPHISTSLFEEKDTEIVTWSSDGWSVVYMRPNETSHELLLENLSDLTTTHLMDLDYTPLASWSPDNHKLYLYKRVDETLFSLNNYELFLIDLEQTPLQPRLLEKTNLPKAAETWIPYSNNIIFQNNEMGWERLFIYDVVTGVTEKIEGLTTCQQHPSWSPTGNAMLVSAISEQSNWDIFLIEFGADTLVTNLTNTPLIDEFQPIWSPTGDNIAYVGFEDFSNTEVSQQIYQMDIVERVPTPVTNSPDFVSHPVWSPNGQALAYLSHQSELWQIIVVNDSGDELWRIDSVFID